MAPLPTPTIPDDSTYHPANALSLFKRSSSKYAAAVLSYLPSRAILAPRQQETTLLLPANGVVAIPATYTDLDGPPAGQVVGIVLGSVFGFILLIWLLYSILGPKDPVVEDSVVTDQPPPRERRKHRSRHHSRSVRSRSRSPSIDVRERTVREVREIHTDGPRIVPMPIPMPPPMYAPPPREPMVERSVVEERREIPRSRSRMTRGTATTDSGADEVVVIEEHSPSPRRDRSRRRSRRGSGTYRPVDPDQWAGGDAPPRRVRR